MSGHVSLLNSYDASAITLKRGKNRGRTLSSDCFLKLQCKSAELSIVKSFAFKLGSSNEDPERWTTLNYSTYNFSLSIDQ